MIAEWADRVIPCRTSQSSAIKLLEEVSELIASERMADPQELADVAILVLDMFNLEGIDMAEAVRSKMRVNDGRHWIVADNGTARHV